MKKAAIFFLVGVAFIHLCQSNPSITVRLPRNNSPIQKFGNLKHQTGQILQSKFDTGKAKVTYLKQQKMRRINNFADLLGGKINTIKQGIRSEILNLKNKF